MEMPNFIDIFTGNKFSSSDDMKCNKFLIFYKPSQCSRKFY